MSSLINEDGKAVVKVRLATNDNNNYGIVFIIMNCTRIDYNIKKSPKTKEIESVD